MIYLAMASFVTLGPSGQAEADMISTIHPDILEQNILIRLDVLTLTFLSCTSSYFLSLLSSDMLWSNICLSTWPSIHHPGVLQIISSAPKGCRSFFCDSFPLLSPLDNPINSTSLSIPPELISAIDIWYRHKPIFSRVLETDTRSKYFLHSCFCLDLQLEDMDSKPLDRNHGLVILVNAIQFGKRGGKTGNGRRKYEEYLAMKSVRRAREVFRQRVIQMACVAGISICVASLHFVTSR